MDISESVQALLNSQERVVEGFYDRLLKRYPELRHHFVSRDLERQAIMVTMSLVEAYYIHHFPATEHYLKVLGDRHYNNAIRPADFVKFRDVMLETMHDFHGEDWSDELNRQWYDAIDLAVSVMLEGYKSSYTF